MSDLTFRELAHEHDYGPTAVPGVWYCQCGSLLLASTEQAKALEAKDEREEGKL